MQKHGKSITEILEICSNLEDKLDEIGWHVGLTGSCLYGGGSGKDIDIIIYPHINDDGSKSSLSPDKVLERIGILNAEQTASDDYSDSCEYIWISYLPDGTRIDSFFLK